TSTCVIDEEAGPPARGLPMGRPGSRLVHMSAGRIDGPGVPVLELAGGRIAEAQSAAPYDAALPLVPTPPRRRATWTRTRWASSYACRPSGLRTRSHAPMYWISRPPKPVLK